MKTYKELLKENSEIKKGINDLILILAIGHKNKSTPKLPYIIGLLEKLTDKKNKSQ